MFLPEVQPLRQQERESPEVEDGPYCCQGAAECGGLRITAGRLEFILYLNAPDGPIVWCAVRVCPLCGDQRWRTGC